MKTSLSADVVVVGLGAVGSAVCHHLARAGASVVGIDRFRPPHEQGSSHGLTRITRLAVGEGEAFVPLVKRSHELWRDLEEDTGQILHRRTGGLIVVSPGADEHAFHGTAGFFARTVSIARRHRIAHEQLDAAQIRERFPLFTPDESDRGYFEHDSGVLFPERIVAAQLAQAVRRGAVLRLDERVLAVEPQGEGVGVCTERAQLAASRVVVTAGPWMRPLVGDSLGRRLRVLRQALFWFRAADPALHSPSHCPCWIWLHGAGASGTAYGFPMIDGIDGVKVATEQDTRESDPDAVDRRVSAQDAQRMFDRHVRGRLRCLEPVVVRTATCLYTSTPDAAFIVRDHPDSAAITLVSACSGHGFKHSAALGEALAQRVLGLPTAASLEAFAP